MAKKKEKTEKETPERLSAVIHSILRANDPALASGQGQPAWNREIAARVRSEIQKRGLGDAGINLVNSMLHHSEIRGLGTFERLEPSRQLRISASRIRYVKAEDLTSARALLDGLNQNFQAICECSDPRVVAGALLVSGALHSGILIPSHLEQLLVRTKVKESLMGLDFIALDLTTKGLKKKIAEDDGSNNADQGSNPFNAMDARTDHPHRQALQSPTAYLSRRYTKAIDRLPWPTPCAALHALTAFLGLPTINLKALTRLARGHWALQLPSWMIEVMQNPDLCCSMNESTWGRWIRAERRDADASPEPDAGLVDLSAWGGEIVSGTCTDGHRLAFATRALMSTLRRKKGESALQRHDFIERLHEWQRTHGQLGGWISTLHEWLTRQALCHEGGVFSTRNKLGPSGLLRYCSGFFHVFVEETRLVPCKTSGDTVEIERAIHRVVERILAVKSPGPGIVGFRSFLGFIAQAFRIDLELDEDFDLAGLPMSHRSRLVSPLDYRAARALIEQNHRSQPYAALRLKVALALGYRVGLRSGELGSRKVSDFVLITAEGRVIGDLRVRDNELYDLKSRSGKRTIPLHALLTPVEMRELYSFLDLRKSMLGGTGWESNLLFADIAKPRANYVDTEVCDEVAEILRRVTFDPNVVFHDLRHSAASMLMIRLHDEGRLKGAFDGLPGYAKMREEFGNHLPLSFTLCGPQADHPSRVYAAARILGHLDPRTTLMYYVHTADLIIGATIQKLSRLPPDTQSLIDGVKPDSVKRRERRRRAGSAPRRMKRTRVRAPKGANPTKKRVYGRHDLGLAGSYSIAHARKVLFGILSGQLLESRRKELRITDEVIERVIPLANTHHPSDGELAFDAVVTALSEEGSLSGLELLIDNVVRKRKPTWIAQVEALGDSPLRIWFSTKEQAEARLEVLQRNGLHKSLRLRKAVDPKTKTSEGFEFFRHGQKQGAIEILLPMFALIALTCVDSGSREGNEIDAL